MSSDWLNLFVDQGREFIDSISRRESDDSPSINENNTTSGSPPSAFLNTADEIVFKQDMEDGFMNESEMLGEGTSKDNTEMPVAGAAKDVYETQLEQLQEQLVDIMIQNQEMATELDSLRESDAAKLSKELEKEKAKRRQLEEKLRKTKEEDGTPKLRRRRRKTDRPKSQLENGPDSEKDTNDKTEHIPGSAEVQTLFSVDPNSVDVETPEEQASLVKRTKSQIYTWYTSLLEKVTLMVWDIISDLTDEEELSDLEDVDGPPLSVKTLRENIKRFTIALKPVTEFFKKVSWVLSWSNPAATMLIFLVYLFSFWHGYAISLVIFLALVQLSANFIYNQFGSPSVKVDIETPPENSSKWTDRFQVVLHVARKVQNFLGSLSDYLEKIKNLLMWKVPLVTFKLYMMLWILLIMSLALNGPQFFTLAGMFLGYKLFIINPLYKRFPKLRKRHDMTLRLWNELPVDSKPTLDGRTHELDETSGTVNHQGQATSSPVAEVSTVISELFCQRYKLTSDEVLVKGWEDGWRTSLMNKNKPLVNIKHGRLYLTQNYLCFERSHTIMDKNILLKLSDIRCVNKYKPLYYMPGTGMSIEVCVKDKDEPYIFAAIYGRNDAYNDIIKTAKEAGLSWAT